MRRSSLILLMSFILLAASPAFAQDELKVSRRFWAGGRSHVISHPADTEDFADTSLVIEAARRALSIYNRLWGGVDSPPLYIDVLATPSATRSFADTKRFRAGIVPVPGTDTTETRDVCVIRVYNNAETRDSAALRFTVAHEIAHCYQAYFIPGVSEFFEETTDDWWTEGSAEWMTTKVYEEATSTPSLSRYQDEFLESHAFILVDGGIAYDGMYFWFSLEAQLGTDAVMEWLKDMPQAQASYDDHVITLPNHNAIFHEYGRMAAAGELAYQPAPDALFAARETVPIDTLPHTADIFTVPFSFDLLTLELPPLEEGQGVTLTASDLATYGMQMSIFGGLPFTDGEPIELCGFDGPVRLIISRGQSDGIDAAALNIDMIECEDAPVDEAGGLPDCLVGTWVVTRFPPIPGITDVAIVSGAQVVEIGADGSVVVTTEDFTIQMVSEISVELTVNASRVEFMINSVGDDGSVNVTAGSSDLGTAFVNVNGTMVEINLNDAAGAVVAPAPIRMECGAGTLFWYFDANGVETSFTLARPDAP